MMKVLDLFSGIGGFSLGLERTGGFQTVAFCEIEPFCRRVLAKHWPGVPCYDDVRSLTAERLAADGIAVDAICGGFPCQPHSLAGQRQASADDRDLWPEYARLIGEIRPAWVLAENVPGLLSSESGRFFGTVLRDLATLGYDAEWHCISASAIGAPHVRDRVWIVGYPQGQRCPEGWPRGFADADQGQSVAFGAFQNTVSDAKGRSAGRSQSRNSRQQTGVRQPIISPSFGRPVGLHGQLDWDSEPGVRRVADGISENVDRDCALGNAVVPQIPELIGRAILAAQASA
jgi:DNA (cytosine-5)-methyltransferase 1